MNDGNQNMKGKKKETKIRKILKLLAEQRIKSWALNRVIFIFICIYLFTQNGIHSTGLLNSESIYLIKIVQIFREIKFLHKI